MADFWVVGPIAWDRVLRVPLLPPSGGFVQATEVAERPGGVGRQRRASRWPAPAPAVHMVGYVGDDEPGARLRAMLTRRASTCVSCTSATATPRRSSSWSNPPGNAPSAASGQTCCTRSRSLPMTIQSGDLVYFAAWHEEFLPAMRQLTGRGAVVATVPPPTVAPGLPADLRDRIRGPIRPPGPRSRCRAGRGLCSAVVVTRGADGSSFTAATARCLPGAPGVGG